MTDTLTLDRFRDLAAAYGGVVARWPVADRGAATRLAATAEGRAILAEALALDTQLDDWTVAAPSADFVARLHGHAPAALRTARVGRRWWWSGFGLAATLAGAVAGMAAVAAVTPVEFATASTSFGDVGGGRVSRCPASASR